MGRYLEYSPDEEPGENGRGSFFARPFLRRQLRIATKNCGFIDPESMEEYVAVGGYRSLLRVLTSYEPESVIDMVEQSGLR